MKEKLKTLLSVLGILALTVGGSALLSKWFGTVEVQRESVQSIKLSTGETQIDAQTYVSLQHGFSLRLPTGYDLIESATGADVVPTGGGRPVMTIRISSIAPKKVAEGSVTYTDGKRFFILSPGGTWPPFAKTAESFKAVIESK